MLLNIYLATTAISWATIFISSAACVKKLKREGYKYIEEKKSISERIMTFISNVFKGSIPVYNILNTIIILCLGDKLYEFVEDKLLEQGKIYKPVAEELNDDCEDKSSKGENTNIYATSVQKTRTEKTYNEMTIEEKLAYLEQEKEMLMSQATPQDENPITLERRRK